jgi:hypothetical protein
VENFDRFVRLQQKRTEILIGLEPLAEAYVKAEEDLDRLKVRALEASVLEDKRAVRLKAELEERTAKLEAMKRDLEDKKKSLAILNRELDLNLRIRAVEDVRQKYRKEYEAAARALFSKLREAEELEKSLLAIGREAEGMAVQVGGALEVLPLLERICVSKNVEMGHWSPMRHFQDDCQRAGIAL